MSKTLFVSYHTEGFWAYDVAVGIFLKHLIDVANKRIGGVDAGWLRDCLGHSRINSVISDFGLHLDENWSDTQLQVILQLMEETCGALERNDFISAAEMEAWDILDGRGVFARGDAQFPTAPVIELGHAIRALLIGTLPAAPDGTWWCYGVKTGRNTIRKLP